MKIAVIIVHYYTPHLLTQAVQLLDADIQRSGLDASIIIVDNGSSESDRQQLAQLPAQVIHSHENRGYAGGLNLGARETDADVLIFMNADVFVFPNCLRNLVAVLEAETHAAGPCLYWDDDATVFMPPGEQYTRYDELLRRVAAWHSWLMPYAHRRWRNHVRRHWLAEQPIVSYDLSGAMLAVRRDAWQSVGAFDERYQLYFEENDWLKRLARAGMVAKYVPNARARHIYNQSAPHESQVGQWFGASEQRFKTQYYGAWFWRIVQKIPAKAYISPDKFDTIAETPPRIALVDLKLDYPVWIEISPFPRGFPAGGVMIADKAQEYWQIPDNVWDFLVPAWYYLRIVDHDGHDIAHYKFQKLPMT
ncbi:MAG: glycosyltransferase family 2 protein [Chloroflexi bacterium]|nr:MAG: hypothetical protein CUN54_00940 [Phototrophicales bacterium]RMF80767.1 MAG: glycosyltransferase family 2 protein [Chloroflexota bacterium]